MRAMMTRCLLPAAPVRRFLALSLVSLAAFVCLPGCVSRRSVESLQRQVQALERENFQLRKDLAEARVRLEMGGARPAGAQAGERRQRGAVASGPDATAPSEPLGSGGERVVYSEPITDASRYTSGPLMPRGQSPGATPAARLINLATQRLDAGDPQGAMAEFRELLARHSGDALADDAQFGMGECLFQMGRHEEAIAEYRKVAESFPYGDRVPAAQLKIAFCHLAMEKRDLAMVQFRTVSESYPGTEAATIARQQIAHLKALGK